MYFQLYAVLGCSWYARYGTAIAVTFSSLHIPEAGGITSGKYIHRVREEGRT